MVVKMRRGFEKANKVGYSIRPDTVSAFRIVGYKLYLPETVGKD